MAIMATIFSTALRFFSTMAAGALVHLKKSQVQPRNLKETLSSQPAIEDMFWAWCQVRQNCKEMPMPATKLVWQLNVPEISTHKISYAK